MIEVAPRARELLPPERRPLVGVMSSLRRGKIARPGLGRIHRRIENRSRANVLRTRLPFRRIGSSVRPSPTALASLPVSTHDGAAGEPIRTKTPRAMKTIRVMQYGQTARSPGRGFVTGAMMRSHSGQAVGKKSGRGGAGGTGSCGAVNAIASPSDYESEKREPVSLSIQSSMAAKVSNPSARAKRSALMLYAPNQSTPRSPSAANLIPLL